MVDIVYVDDQHINIRVMEAIADSKLKMSINSYFNPIDAIEFIQEDQPKIVILDFHMPEINGMNSKVLMHNVWPIAKYIMLTGYSSQQTSDLAANVGFDAFLPKPVNVNHLKETIDRLLK